MGINKKKLTEADLGLAKDSNQIHIGLLKGMISDYSDDDKLIEALFYTPALGVEVPAKGIVNGIKRKTGKVEAPYLKSGGKDAFGLDGALNLFALIRHFATTGAQPRSLWVEERADKTLRFQVLPESATGMITPGAAPTPATPLTSTPGTLNDTANSFCRSKPFLILAGPSGTGKSRWIRRQAYLTHPATQADRQSSAAPPNYQLVSVKPNWHDSSELLGYVTRMGLAPGRSAHYVVTDFVRFLVRAWHHPDTPHWLCLDEMNLAPVEQYLAEYLSVIETRRIHQGSAVTDPIIPARTFAALGDADWHRFCEDSAVHNPSLSARIRKEGLALPPNLIVVGTVNMDETTHSFSRKVLDRAFVWELPIGDLSKSWDALRYPATHAPWQPLGATSGDEAKALLADLTLDAKWQEQAAPADALLAWLEAANGALADTPFQISYRVRDELLLLAAARQVSTVDELRRLLDEGLYAKILPRVEGDAARVRRPLCALGRLLADDAGLAEWSLAFPGAGEYDQAQLRGLKADTTFTFDPKADPSDPFAPALPWRRSLRKIRSMLLRLDGHFSSYWD